MVDFPSITEDTGVSGPVLKHSLITTSLSWSHRDALPQQQTVYTLGEKETMLFELRFIMQIPFHCPQPTHHFNGKLFAPK